MDILERRVLLVKNQAADIGSPLESLLTTGFQNERNVLIGLFLLVQPRLVGFPGERSSQDPEYSLGVQSLIEGIKDNLIVDVIELLLFIENY